MLENYFIAVLMCLLGAPLSLKAADTQPWSDDELAVYERAQVSLSALGKKLYQQARPLRQLKAHLSATDIDPATYLWAKAVVTRSMSMQIPGWVVRIPMGSSTKEQRFMLPDIYNLDTVDYMVSAVKKTTALVTPETPATPATPATPKQPNDQP